MSHILLAEDDNFLADGMSRKLKLSGYVVDHVRNGVDAELAATTTPYDLLILDIGLPKRDGREVLMNLRNRGCSLPILILTALDSPDDLIKGLDLGANDYMSKPFNMAELEARIRALLRQNKWSNHVKITSGSLTFDTGSRRVTIDREPVDLSPREFAALELLLERVGRVVRKSDFLDHFSEMDKDMTENALDIVVHRLRKKVEHSGCIIRSVRGLGYIIEKSG